MKIHVYYTRINAICDDNSIIEKPMGSCSNIWSYIWWPYILYNEYGYHLMAHVYYMMIVVCRTIGFCSNFEARYDGQDNRMMIIYISWEDWSYIWWLCLNAGHVYHMMVHVYHMTVHVCHMMGRIWKKKSFFWQPFLMLHMMIISTIWRFTGIIRSYDNWKIHWFLQQYLILHMMAMCIIWCFMSAV